MNAQRNFDHDSDNKFGNMDKMLDEAEAVFRRGVTALNEWTSQARALLQNKPATILGAAGISGMVAGTLIRHSMAARRAPRSNPKDGPSTPVDPVVLLAGGLVLGLSIGPKLIEQAVAALNRLERQGENEEQSTIDVDGTRLRATGSMDEKPFEK